MLQSRLAVAGAVISSRRAGAIWAFGKRGLSQGGDPSPSQGGATAPGTSPLPTGRSADPAVHASELLGADAEAASIAATAKKGTSTGETEPLVSPKPPTTASPKLEHTEVGLPSKPNIHQRRRLSAQGPPKGVDDATCAGLDGSPWPDDAEGQKAQKRAQEADNKEYFKHHKASPLSELEFADSRKPITQATSHGSPGPVVSYFSGDTGMVVWMPEQLETAEETMLKAIELWKWNKMRGDPDTPHGRILRQLRGEWW